MKPILKLAMIVTVPLIAGYLFRVNLGPTFSSALLILMVSGSILVVPLVIETIVKFISGKNKSESGVKISKIAGYLFLLGIALFCLGLGYSFAG